MLEKLKHKQIFKMSPSKTILLGFAVVILIGAFLLCTPITNKAGEWIPFTDALFTATTSVCVTGLMVFDIAATLNLFGQFIVMLLIQIGGLGVIAVTSFVFLMIGKKINYSTRIALQESLSQEDNQGVVKTIIKVLIITLICEAIGFLMLIPSMVKFTGSFWRGLFSALFLAVSAFCNAGIDPLGAATPEFSNLICFASNPFVLVPVMLLIVLGGIGSIVILDILSYKKNHRTTLHTRVVLWTTLVLIVGGAGVILIAEWNNPATLAGFGVGDKIMNAFFQSITTRTAGFVTFDQGAMKQISIITSQFLMFIGGSPVSTAGGIKTTTLFVFLLILFRNTNQNGNIIYKNKKITHVQLMKAVRITLIAILCLCVSTISIYFFEGEVIGFQAILYETISAICTVGLSFGITPTLAVGSKLMLIVLMYIGRIGMLTIPLAFKTKDTVGIEYSEAKIIVG